MVILHVHCHHDDHPGVTLIGTVIVLALVFALVSWLNKLSNEKDRRQLAYINAHQCQIISYIGGGKHQKPVYRCDNGQWAHDDLRKEANKD